MTWHNIMTGTTPDWYDDANCASTDPEAFFPEKGMAADEAKRVCFRCVVREVCLADALEREEPHGVWGGFTERERRKLRKGYRPKICAWHECDRPIVSTSGVERRYCSQECSRLGVQLRQQEVRHAKAAAAALAQEGAA